MVVCVYYSEDFKKYMFAFPLPLDTNPYMPALLLNTCWEEL